MAPTICKWGAAPQYGCCEPTTPSLRQSLHRSLAVNGSIAHSDIIHCLAARLIPARPAGGSTSFSARSLMVYIPGISNTFVRRKGGGKGGRGGGKGSKSSSGKTTKKSIQNLPAGKKSASLYGNGGGRISTITSGLFAGRTVGGATRTNVFGNRYGLDEPFFDIPLIFITLSHSHRKYGSGYPGYPIGVAGYGFPFFFWPLAFSGSYVYGAHYIHTHEVSTPSSLPVP